MNFRVAKLLACTVVAGLIAMPAMAADAKQKTVKACEDEWKANRAAMEANGKTEKAYVAECRSAAPAAAAPAAKAPAAKADAKAAPAADKPKTVKACEDEWKANRAAMEAKGTTQKAYVAECRGKPAAAAPAPAPAAATPAPAAPAPAAPAAPAKTEAAKPAATPPAAGKPTMAGQFATEAAAKSHCPSDTVVWGNTDSHIYHFAGHSDYGHTKEGAYLCEKEAAGEGFRAAKDEKHP